MPGKAKNLKGQIVAIGNKLYSLGLVSGRAGNLSLRLDKNNILITATGSCLGNLRFKDIIKVDLASKKPKKKPVSSEFPLHRLIYKNCQAKVIIHCHPPLTNAYFCVYSSLKALTLETKFYLGELPVLKQKAPTVTRPELVITALKKARLVVLKNHGVVCIGESFSEASSLVETLESAVKVAVAARLLKQGHLNKVEKHFKKCLA